MSNINWPEVYQRLSQLQKHDAKLYRNASVVFFLLAIVTVFIFALASLALIIVSGYLYFNYKKGLNGSYSTLIEAVIIKKSSYYQISAEPEIDEPKFEESPSLFILEILVKGTYKIQSTGVNPMTIINPKTLKVNRSIYERCKVGLDYQFIMSLTGDMLGFIDKQNVELFISTMGGKVFSKAINQSIDFFNTQLFSEEKA